MKKCKLNTGLKSYEGFVKAQICLYDEEFFTQKEGDVRLGGDAKLTAGRLTVFKNG